jgi:hypothetical protein
MFFSRRGWMGEAGRLYEDGAKPTPQPVLAPKNQANRALPDLVLYFFASLPRSSSNQFSTTINLSGLFPPTVRTIRKRWSSGPTAY